MDKKIQKKIDVLQLRRQKLKAQVAGMHKQNDEPEETRRMEEEIKAVEAEIAKLKSS